MEDLTRPVLVEDPADPRLADYQALTDVELRRRSEPAEGIFIAEGELVIRRALRAGYAMRSALLTHRWWESLAPVVEAVDAPVYVGSPALLAAVTGFHVHRGALASMARRPLPDASDLLSWASRVVVLEDVNSHTNLGAIFRCAAGLGMDAVLLSPSCADPLYRRSVRVSMGEVFAVPYARLTPWPAGLTELAATGFELLALTPDPDAADIAEVGAMVADDDKLALIFGAEGAGLTPGVLAVAAAPVRIPMSAGVDSLNVAAAAAIACHALRRRGRPAGG